MSGKISIRNLFAHFLCAGLVLALMHRAEAAPGDYDPDFGIGGVAKFETPDTWSCCLEQQQPEGKLLVGLADGTVLKIRRHHTDGSIDTSFGYNGEAVRQIVNGGYPIYVLGTPYKMKAQPDGKILVFGIRRFVDGYGEDYYRRALWRFTAEGFPDPTFSGDGVFTFSDNYFYSPNLSECDLELSDSGKIYVVFKVSGSVITRFNPDGTIDGSFGSSGTVARPGFSGHNLAVASSRTGGAIYLGGFSNAKAKVYRYHNTGAVDTNYGFFGVADLDGTCFETNVSGIVDMQLQADGKLVFGGSYFDSFTPFDSYLARFNTSGFLDSTFNDDGIIGCPRTKGYFKALKIQSDRKIVMINHSYPGSEDWRFQRFLENGQVDTHFVPEGPISEFNFGTDLVIQAGDGKIVVLAKNHIPNGYRLSRYLP